MVMRKFIFFLFFVLLITACENPNDPKVEAEPYVMLHIGNVRQYYSLQFGEWFQDEITDTVRRSDGKKVFKRQSTFMSIPEDAWFYKKGEFIEDGFLWSGELKPSPDTINYPGNSLLEIRICPEYPQEGLMFNEWDTDIDSLLIRRKVELLDSLVLPFKTFYNIQKVSMTKDKRNFRMYFAEGFGHIKTEITYKNITDEITLTYLRLDGREYGKFTEFPEFYDNDTSNLKPNNDHNFSFNKLY